MLLFVTGVAGSGKSTLCAELLARGCEAHDADDGIARHVTVPGGEPVESPPRALQTAEWAAGHRFLFDLEVVRALQRAATSAAPVFLLGAAFGDDAVIAMASRSWYLDLDEAELRRRIASRPPDAYGHAPHELEAILAWHAAAAGRYESLGAQRLDATRPVAELADEILAAAATGISY